MSERRGFLPNWSENQFRRSDATRFFFHCSSSFWRIIIEVKFDWFFGDGLHFVGVHQDIGECTIYPKYNRKKKTGPNPAQRDTDVGRKRRQTDWSRERGRVIQVFDSRSEPRIKIAPWQVAISVEFAEPLDQRRRRRRPILPVQFSLLSRFEAQTQNLKSIAQWHVTEISIGFDGSHDVPDKKW